MTDGRKQFVDFTEPFEETGLGFLVHKNNVNGIKSFSDLSNQTAIKYGMLRSGYTYSHFAQSQDPVYQKIYQEVTNNPDNLVTTYQEALEKVKAGSYAFIMVKTSAEYIAGTDCDLTLVEPHDCNLDIHYAIALRKNSSHLGVFNDAIRQLKSTGQLNRMRNRYWKKCGVLSGITVIVSIAEGKGVFF